MLELWILGCPSHLLKYVEHILNLGFTQHMTVFGAAAPWYHGALLFGLDNCSVAMVSRWQSLFLVFALHVARLADALCDDGKDFT
jgi:hypothetical protein